MPNLLPRQRDRHLPLQFFAPLEAEPSLENQLCLKKVLRKPVRLLAYRGQLQSRKNDSDTGLFSATALNCIANNMGLRNGLFKPDSRA